MSHKISVTGEKKGINNPALAARLRRTVKAAPARAELCVAMPRAMRTPRPRSAHRAR